ncbi:MAG: DUF5606 domain-containing protein [Bacteroidales bacterium]
MKTDLTTILSVAGQPGLYKLLTRNKSGIIVEQLGTGKRTIFDVNSRISSLGDIAIYTDAEDLPVRDLFGKMLEALGEDDAPSAKSAPTALSAGCVKACPHSDHDRFYVSHMKKCVEWYNNLKHNASLDFMTDEERKAEQEKAEAPENEAAAAN